MHLHSFSAADFKVPGRGWSSALLEKGAAVTVGNVYEPFLGACHRFDIFVDRLLDGYTVAEASWMSMPVLSWQGLVFGDPLYRPYARMKDMDVEPTEEDRYFQGWWASSVQFGDRWKDRSARLMESARKAPFSCLYEALALECLYRKEPARAGELLSSALDGAADARTRARLLLEILMAERARGGTRLFCSGRTASGASCLPPLFFRRWRNGLPGWLRRRTRRKNKLRTYGKFGLPFRGLWLIFCVP